MHLLSIYLYMYVLCMYIDYARAVRVVMGSKYQNIGWAHDDEVRRERVSKVIDNRHYYVVKVIYACI